MLLPTLLLALATTATTTLAQIMPVPHNLTLANTPIPGSKSASISSNSTLHLSNKQSTTTSSGRCGIHVLQSKCPQSFDGIILRSVDWNGNVQYEGWCSGTVCAWPLLGMGDFLVSVQEGYTTQISFYRQGTVSTDSWKNTDPEPRCSLGKWNGCTRQFDCGFGCGAYGGGT